jgi:hypothetical protein
MYLWNLDNIKYKVVQNTAYLHVDHEGDQGHVIGRCPGVRADVNTAWKLLQTIYVSIQHNQYIMARKFLP